MKREVLGGILAGALLFSGISATAQELGFWRADSNTAHDVTGDVGISETKIAIEAFYPFNIVHARDLTPAETSAVFDTDIASNSKAHLYGLVIPSNRKFLHKNTICGTEDTHWMVAYAEGNSLALAFFSGEQAPTFAVDSIANSSNFCGMYRYVR
jgi:hypothetical protein